MYKKEEQRLGVYSRNPGSGEGRTAQGEHGGVLSREGSGDWERRACKHKSKYLRRSSSCIPVVSVK